MRFLFRLWIAACALTGLVRADVHTVAFGEQGFVRLATHTDNTFLCTTRGCVPLLDNVTYVSLRAQGDVVRLVDARLRTRQWIAWGHPTGAWDLQSVEARVRTVALAQVWAMNTSTWRGITWNTDHWQRAVFDTRECLRTAALGRADGIALLHLEVYARTRLVLRDWITPLCGDDSDDTPDLWWLPDTSDDKAFWSFVATHSVCEANQLRAQARSVMHCMTASALDDAPTQAHPGWALPFDPYARFDYAADTWYPQKRTEWQERWHVLFGATPTLLCRPIALQNTQDAVAFHSIVFALDAAHMSPTFVDDIQRLTLPAHVAPCPPWFFA